MAHYAKVRDSQVVEVITADEEFFEHFRDTSPGQWIQTSYNTRGGVHYGQDGTPDGGVPLRKNYAGIGYTYDYILDAFIPPKPYASWILNEETCLWEAPVTTPQDNLHRWDEESLSWVIDTPPVVE